MRTVLVSFLLHLLALLPVWGQGVPVPPAVVGSWEIDVQKQSEGIGGQLDAIGKASADRLLESMKSRVYLFRKDGSFHISWTMGGSFASSEGTWALTDEGVLELVDGVGARSRYRYGMDNGTLRLDLLGGGRTGFLNTLFLKNINP